MDTGCVEFEEYAPVQLLVEPSQDDAGVWVVRQVYREPILGTPLERTVEGHVLAELSDGELRDEECVEAIIEAVVPFPLGYEVWQSDSPSSIHLLLVRTGEERP